MIDPDYEPLQALFPRMVSACGRRTSFLQYPNVPYGARVSVKPRLPGKPVQNMPPSPHRQGRRGYETPDVTGATIYRRLGTVVGCLAVYLICVVCVPLSRAHGATSAFIAVVIPIFAAFVAARIAAASPDNDAWDRLDAALFPILCAHGAKFALGISASHEVVLWLPVSLVCGAAGLVLAKMFDAVSMKLDRAATAR